MDFYTHYFHINLVSFRKMLAVIVYTGHRLAINVTCHLFHIPMYSLHGHTHSQETVANFCILNWATNILVWSLKNLPVDRTECVPFRSGILTNFKAVFFLNWPPSVITTRKIAKIFWYILSVLWERYWRVEYCANFFSSVLRWVNQIKSLRTNF